MLLTVGLAGLFAVGSSVVEESRREVRTEARRAVASAQLDCGPGAVPCVREGQCIERDVGGGALRREAAGQLSLEGAVLQGEGQRGCGIDVPLERADLAQADVCARAGGSSTPFDLLGR